MDCLSHCASQRQHARQPRPGAARARMPPIRSRLGPRPRRPAKLRADKGYDHVHLRRWLRKRGIRHRITRKGIESSQRLGRHPWVVERTVSWLAGCRRLHRSNHRYAVSRLAPSTGGRSRQVQPEVATMMFAAKTSPSPAGRLPPPCGRITWLTPCGYPAARWPDRPLSAARLDRVRPRFQVPGNLLRRPARLAHEFRLNAS